MEAIRVAGQAKNQDRVQIVLKDIYRDKDRVYLRYAIQNNGKSSYVLANPEVFSLKSPHSSSSLYVLSKTQLVVYHTALRLGLPIKGAGLPEGIEIFPRQDEIGPNEFGNAIRGPLGVHRGAKESRGWRFWFYNADYSLADQLAYLGRLRRVTEAELKKFVAGKDIPAEFSQHASRPETPRRYYTSVPSEFRILDYVEVRRQVGRNWIARCPSCAGMNRDRSGDNLAIAVEEPRKYICWAGCSKEMIREALGRPIPQKRYA